MSVEGEQEQSRLDLFIVPVGEPALRHATLLARDFRAAGISAEVSEGKVKRAMEIANKLRARKALFVGEDEITAGRYTLKDMDTGQQDNLTKDEIVAQFVHSDLN
jgi:histidyl-tRNA synthetase